MLELSFQDDPVYLESRPIQIKFRSAPVKLTQADIHCLQKLVEILELFEDAILFTQGSNIISASLLIPSVNSLRTFLTNFNAQYSVGDCPKIICGEVSLSL